MIAAISGLLVLPTFLLAMWVIFTGLLDIATDQTDSLREANELHAERLGTLVSIASIGATNCPYLFMAGVDNNSSKRVSFGDFSKIDFFVDYTNVTGDNTAEWLGYPSSWTVSSITGDNSNLNMWDPGETANIIFSVIPELQAGSKGTLAVAVPGGSSDSAYFDAGPQRTCYYLRNNPTPPVGGTASQTALSMDTGDYPSATILYNYDTDRDAKDGLLIKKGGTGVEETGDGMYQVWRTGVLGGGLAISGDVSLDFWSALKDFKKSAAGKVTMFLRDYDPGTGHTEIGNGSALNSDWQGGSNRFVLKGITITGVDYTLSPGHELEIKLIVDATADDDMWFAYDASPYVSVLTLP